MINRLHSLALLLIILWLIAHFVFSSFGVGNIINVLLVLASFVIMLRFIQGDKVT